MFKTLINAWNVKDIRTKMLYTLLLVVIYRFGSFIPVPGVDASKIAAAADTYSILSFLNLLSGGNCGVAFFPTLLSASSVQQVLPSWYGWAKG